jgi:hypothetical protein
MIAGRGLPGPPAPGEHARIAGFANRNGTAVMAEEHRRIDPTPYMEVLDLSDAAEVGPRPELMWLPVDRLVVDPRYQREINRRGAQNVRAIAKAFSWLKFGIVIVAPVEDGLYAIVDGQHRTFGAAGRSLKEVPCLVIPADARTQADVFVSVNSQVTLMTPLQIHASRVAAGDADAIALVEACAAGGVTICRYPVPGNKMRPGETLAVGVLYKSLRTYGPRTLSMALKCITGTHDGNVGLVRASLVKALCGVLDAEPAYAASESRLVAAIGDLCLETELDNGAIEARKRKTNVEAVLAARIFAHLEARLGKMAA